MFDVSAFLPFYESLHPRFRLPPGYSAVLEELKRPVPRVVVHKPPRCGGSTFLQRLLMFGRLCEPEKLAAYFTYAEALAGNRVVWAHRLLRQHLARTGCKTPLVVPEGGENFRGFIHGMVGLGRPPGVNWRSCSLVVVDSPFKTWRLASTRHEQVRVRQWFSRVEKGQQRGLLHEVTADTPIVVFTEYRHGNDVVDFLRLRGFRYLNVEPDAELIGPTRLDELKQSLPRTEFSSIYLGHPAPLKS